MRKIILMLLLAIFLNECSQKLAIEISPDYSPEFSAFSEQDTTGKQIRDITEKIDVDGKSYAIKSKKELEIVKIPRKVVKKLDELEIKTEDEELWTIDYTKESKSLTISPKTYEIPVDLYRQNPDDFEKYRPFQNADIDNLRVFYKDEELSTNRCHSGSVRPDQIQLQIPLLSELKMDDYRIDVQLADYLPYSESLIDIEDKKIKLNLEWGKLKLNPINKEESEFIPRKYYLENTRGLLREFSDAQIKEGMNIYDIEYPVKLFGEKYRCQFYDINNNKIDTLIFENEGNYDFSYNELPREIPVVFYDMSSGLISSEEFENWINEKKLKSDGIFIFVTNGYEKLFNEAPMDFNNIIGKINRITPRTSNILESITNFKNSFDNIEFMSNFSDPVKFGNKITKKYYFFLSDENVGRLDFALNKFEKQINELEIDKEQLDIYIRNSEENQEFIEKLRDENFTVIGL